MEDLSGNRSTNPVSLRISEVSTCERNDNLNWSFTSTFYDQRKVLTATERVWVPNSVIRTILGPLNEKTPT